MQSRAAKTPKIDFCAEKHALIMEFVQAVQDLSTLQRQQSQAVIENDQDFSRFDVLLHMANERKDRAKYALLEHLERHHCEG